LRETQTIISGNVRGVFIEGWQLFHETTRYLADQKSYDEQTRIERQSLQAAARADKK